MPIRDRLRKLTSRRRIVEVEEAALCVRALGAHMGQPSAVELLPGGASQVTRAALTARVMAAQQPVPWPAAVMRQLDPGDPAFLPAIGIHPVLAARDRTWLGLPGRARIGWVDALGWAGVGDGPSVTVWFSDGRNAYPVGRRPDEDGAAPVQVEQRRSNEVFGVITRCTRGGLLLELHHWPVVLEGRVAWAFHARLTLDGPAPRPVRLAYAIRPAGPDGAAPIFHLTRDADGLWAADGTPILALARTGDEVLVGRKGEPDPWQQFCGSVVGVPALRPGRVDQHCSAGMASAVEVYRTTLSPGEPFSRLAVLAPPPGTPATLVRTSGRALWAGAAADRSGMMAAGAVYELERHGRILEACRMRLLQGPVEGGIAGCMGAVALARLGFVRRAGDRIERWLARVRRDGTYPHAEAEESAVLAWAAATYVLWTGDSAWTSANLVQWSRLLDRLAREELEPGGRYLIGPEGSARWSDLWRGAALLGSAAALRDVAPGRDAWAIAGGRIREGLPAELGAPPWSAARTRSPDGSAAGMLTAAWLGLLPPDHPGVVATADHVRRHHWYGGGVLLHGGANTALTALLLTVQARADRAPLSVERAIGAVADLASPTGALPTARHPFRGALLEGDDGLSAALFVLMALDLVQVGRGTVTVLPGLATARDLPTPFGRLDVETLAPGRRRVTGRWRGAAPRLVVVERPQDAE